MKALEKIDIQQFEDQLKSTTLTKEFLLKLIEVHLQTVVRRKQFEWVFPDYDIDCDVSGSYQLLEEVFGFNEKNNSKYDFAVQDLHSFIDNQAEGLSKIYPGELFSNRKPGHEALNKAIEELYKVFVLTSFTLKMTDPEEKEKS